MKNWQEQCAEILDYIESFFPDVRHEIKFRKDAREGVWIFTVEAIRTDWGPHYGAKVDQPYLRWLQIRGEDVERLPGEMMERVRQRILEWQQEGLEKVRKKALELEEVKNEMQKRLDASIGLDKIAEEI